MKKASSILILLIALLIVATRSTQRQLQSSSMTITTSRSTQLAELCTKTDRTSLYLQYDLAAKNPYKEQFSTFYELDNTIFDQFLDLDFAGINNSLRKNIRGYTTFIVPAYIGLAFLIVLAPILLIILCCPSKCCLRDKLEYTSCEQMWPVLVTILLGGAVVGASFAGIFSEYKAQKGFNHVSCSGIIWVDDALYGAASVSGSNFFSGTQTITTQLQSLSANINAVLGNFTTLSSTGNNTSQTLGLMSSALANIATTPEPTGGNLTLNYNTPIASLNTTSTIPSLFPAILGSKDQNSTLVGTAYLGMIQAYTNLATITGTVDYFLNTSTSFITNLNKIINQTNASAILLKSTLKKVRDTYAKFEILNNDIQKFLYGAIIGFVLLYLIILIIFAVFDKMWFRYMLYVLGVILFVITLLAFIFFFVFSYSSTIFNSFCNYFNNPANFVHNMGRLGISETVATQYSICLPGQIGDIVTMLNLLSGGGAENRISLYTLQLVMTNITSFNQSYLNSIINTSYQPLTTKLAQYASAQTLDITDSSSITQLKYASTSSNFNCSVGNFAKDSWIPSISQTDNAIPCQSPAGASNSDNSTCTSTTAFNNANTANCQGCMDTFSLLYNATSQATAASILTGRYPNCSTFNNQLANIWQNFYLIKKNVLGPVVQREYTARKSVQAVTQSITNNLAPTFNSTITQLYQISSPVLTPNYGLLWGLNCQAVGEDLFLFLAVTCTNTFSYSYFHRIITGIISFGLLVLLCGNTCSIFRRSKDILQSQAAAPQNNAQIREAAYIDPGSSARIRDGQV